MAQPLSFSDHLKNKALHLSFGNPEHLGAVAKGTRIPAGEFRVD